MGQYQDDVLGTMEATFQLNGPSGPKLKDSSDVVELRNAGDSAYATGRAKNIAASGGANDIVTLLDLQGRIPEITFDFDGASAPSPGANTGEFGMCHTTGGGYTQGRVYYDTGAALTLLPTEVVRTITTSTAISGSISFIANGIYAAPDGVTWVLKGDGTGATTGLDRVIKVDFDYNDSGTPVDSTTSIPDTAVVTYAAIRIKTVFGGSPTIALTVNGSSPETLIGTGGNDPTAAHEYVNHGSHEITSSNEGVVRVDLQGAATSGTGYALVKYAIPLA
jgi:hypothetical protein